MDEQRAKPALQPASLTLSRHFAAPRELVFQAWSSADHIKRWFSPETLHVPEAEIEFHAGGVFNLCMRTPAGQDHWMRGRFTAIEPPSSLAFTAAVVVDGETRFNVATKVTFETAASGTIMTVRQDYEMIDPAFIGAVDGAPEGWRTTLDKLEREVARLADPPSRSAAHGIFSLRRTYDVAPALVFRALSDQAAKARWFTGGEGFTAVERSMDVRPGGREILRGLWPSGTTTLFDAVYFDVVADQRLVYAYEMHLNGRKISVSLATMELQPSGAGTELTVTEQGAFLDGYDDAGSRERGTADLLDRLGASLQSG